MTLKNEIQVDKQEAERIEESKQSFLKKAVANYAVCLLTTLILTIKNCLLTHDGRYDVRAVFRLISLWFSNTHSKDINEFMAKYACSCTPLLTG